MYAQLCYERYILFTGTIFYYPDGAPRLELNFQRINFLSRNENLDIEIIKFLSFIFNFPPRYYFYRLRYFEKPSFSLAN